MTANQLQYWNLQETKRSNLAKEGEEKRKNVENINAEYSKLEETKRHNQAAETENIRHNKVSETTEKVKAVTRGAKDVSQAFKNITDGFSGVGKLIGGILGSNTIGGIIK